MNCCLVIDISNANLKILKVYLKDNKVFMEEIYKCSEITFRNKCYKICLDIDKIIKEINKCLINIKQMGCEIESISVNSSINEFVLLDEENNLIGDILINYTISSVYLNKVLNQLGMPYIYRKSGISFNSNNALYKLMLYKDLYSDEFIKVKKILFLSDYINYRLTGNIYQEKTQFSLTQFFNFTRQNIDLDILEYLGLKDSLEFNLIDHGKIIGNCKITGKDVISPYGNDLLSSFLVTDALNKNYIYIVNSKEGVIGCTEEYSKMYFDGSKFDVNHHLFNNNFVKIFKYIPCYGVIDNLIKNIGNVDILKQELEFIDEGKFIDSVIDFDNDSFRDFTSFTNIVKYYFDFKVNNLNDSKSNFIKMVYNSFAIYYRKCISDLEKLTGGVFDSICIVGNHSLNDYYNQFIADITLKNLEVGPMESGVIGNAVNQFIALGKINRIEDVYEILKNSFSHMKYRYNAKKAKYKYIEDII